MICSPMVPAITCLGKVLDKGSSAEFVVWDTHAQKKIMFPMICIYGSKYVANANQR